MILLEAQTLTTVMSLSIGAFLLLVLLLVGILLIAKAKLLPSGEVSVTINDNEEDKFIVSPGGTLLSTLQENKILLPSACGGGGTCGMCECEIHEGGGEILPTEKPFFTRKEIKENKRLACQVITVNFKDFDIEKEYHEDWDNFNMWDLTMKNPEETYRAYSMANHPAEGNIVMLNIRIATPPWDRGKSAFANINPGICSSYIFSLKPGDKVTVSGPYGEFFIKDTQNEMMFIEFQTQKTKRKATFWYGARSLREVFYQDHFDKIAEENENFSWDLALSEPQKEDNWTGPTGFIHQVIYENYLKNHEEPEDIEYYLCGPPMMNSAVEKMLFDLGVPKENIMFDDFG